MNYAEDIRPWGSSKLPQTEHSQVRLEFTLVVLLLALQTLQRRDIT